jgi:hypothetical protein
MRKTSRTKRFRKEVTAITWIFHPIFRRNTITPDLSTWTTAAGRYRRGQILNEWFERSPTADYRTFSRISELSPLKSGSVLEIAWILLSPLHSAWLLLINFSGYFSSDMISRNAEQTKSFCELDSLRIAAIELYPSSIHNCDIYLIQTFPESSHKVFQRVTTRRHLTARQTSAPASISNV